MHVDKFKNSTFLTRADVDPPILVTITGLEEHNLAKSNEKEKLRQCLTFEECEKPLVMNLTNAQNIAMITGEDDTDNWPGHKIVLFNDLTVLFNGERGGIRARAPKNKAAAAPAKPVGKANAKPAARKPAPEPEPEPEPVDDGSQPDLDDNVPF